MNPETPRNALVQAVTSEFDYWASLLPGLNQRVDRATLADLLLYLVGLKKWDEVSAVVSGSGEVLSSVEELKSSGEPHGVKHLMLQILSLLNLTKAGSLFEELEGRALGEHDCGIFDIAGDGSTLSFLPDTPAGVLARCLLIANFPDCQKVGAWCARLLWHRGQVAGCVFYVRSNEPESGGGLTLPSFQLYQDFVLDNATTSFIRKLRASGTTAPQSPVLVFIYNAERDAFFLNGLSEIGAPQSTWTKGGLASLRAELEECLSAPLPSGRLTDRITRHEAESGVPQPNHGTEDIFDHYASQMAKAWEYLLFRKFRSFIYESEQFKSFNFLDLLFAYLHLAVPYTLLALWMVREETCTLTKVRSYKLDGSVGVPTLSELPHPNPDFENKPLHEAWCDPGNDTPALSCLDNNAFFSEYNIKADWAPFAVRGVAESAEWHRLRLYIRPVEKDKTVTASVLDLVIKNNDKWVFFADEICGFISQMFGVIRHFKEQAELEADAKRGRLARNIRHEMNHLMGALSSGHDKLQKELKESFELSDSIERRVRYISYGLELAARRINKMTASENKSWIGSVNLLHFSQFISDMDPIEHINIHGYPTAAKFVVWPEEDCAEAKQWNTRLSDSALYAVWNNLRSNAVDVLNLYTWPAGSECRNKLRPRLKEVNASVPPYQERFKPNPPPQPKLLVLLSIDEKKGIKRLWFLDNAPELAGPGKRVKYESEGTRWNHYGLTLLKNIKEAFDSNREGHHLEIRGPGPLEEPERLLAEKIVREQSLEHLFDFKSLNHWTLAGIEVVEVHQ